jgi:lycopene beta-cyclase
MESIKFDYVIVGGGAAGLHLAFAMSKDLFFRSKKIGIIEKSGKNSNDRTWCFWEKGEGSWEDIVSYSWNNCEFITNEKVTSLNLEAYHYKMIKAIDFYKKVITHLKETPNFVWIQDEVLHIQEGSPSKIVTTKNNYSAFHIFDSRITPNFYKNEKHINLIQHFKGWIIETKEDVFNPDSFVMMDFRLKYPESTSFTYVLPYTAKKALIEFTFFSPSLVADQVYDSYIKKYIEQVLGCSEYSIFDTEKGIIPMSNYPFHNANNKSVTKIGTAGSWVKGSSGYSFKNAERFSKRIVNNIKNKHLPSHDLFKRRFKKYDTLFLHVLFNHNDLGEEIFSNMYTKNSISLLFSFLDEETTFAEELKIINSLRWRPFINAVYKQLIQ